MDGRDDITIRLRPRPGPDVEARVRHFLAVANNLYGLQATSVKVGGVEKLKPPAAPAEPAP